MNTVITTMIFSMGINRKPTCTNCYANDKSLLPQWTGEVIGALEHPLVCGFTLAEQVILRLIRCRATG